MPCTTSTASPLLTSLAIYEGDNDTGSYQVPPETIASQFEAIVAKIHATLPETRIYAFSVKPSVRRWLVWPEAEKANELLEALYERNDLLTYVDVATPMLDANGEVFQDIFVDDNLPLNEKGYKIDFVVGELGAGGVGHWFQFMAASSCGPLALASLAPVR